MSIQENSRQYFYSQICIALVWVTVIYSTVLQDKFITIQNGMLLLGGAVLITLFLANCNEPMIIHDFMTNESICMLLYMSYMLLIGFVFSNTIGTHIVQWITCMEYLFLLIAISSLIIKTGSDTFHYLLLFEAIVLAVIFIRNPVYYGGGRYSISISKNPNALGMSITTGIWVVLYLQQKKQMPLILCLTLIGIFGYCIMLTGSRKSLVAAGIVITLWLLFCFIPSLNERGPLQSLFMLAILIVIAIITWRTLQNVYYGSAIANRMNNLSYEVTEGDRSNMYRDGIALFKHNPLFGLGFQSFANYYGSYSHATLVEIPVSGGIIGSLLYIAVYYISIRKTMRVINASKEKADMVKEHAKARMLLVLWVAMLFYSTCIIHPYQFESFVIFGIIFGQTESIERQVNESPSEQLLKRNGSKYIKYV